MTLASFRGDQTLLRWWIPRKQSEKGPARVIALTGFSQLSESPTTRQVQRSGSSTTEVRPSAGTDGLTPLRTGLAPFVAESSPHQCWIETMLVGVTTRHHRPAARALRALLVMTFSLALAACSPTTAAHQSTSIAQRLERFYAIEPNAALPLGTLLREEPLTTMNGSPVTVLGAKANRILYISRSADGQQTTSSAMLFVPTSAVPKGGRPVVAWAHPARSPSNVAPSRSSDPLLGMQPWLDEMVSRGWAVVATDYSGLGTPGRQNWLDGKAEANDVVGSVLAAQHDSSVGAGTQWVAWGHSYGGHAVLWTAALARQLAPSLSLVGVAAAAPVAELVRLEGAAGQSWEPLVEKQIPPPQTNVPVLIVQGTKDSVVPASTTATLQKSWCAQGVPLTVEWVKGATHESVVKVTSRGVVAWLSQRLTDHGPRTFPNGCSVNDGSDDEKASSAQ